MNTNVDENYTSSCHLEVYHSTSLWKSDIELV